MPCLDYCSYLISAYMLDKLQKSVCRTVGLTLAASLEPLAHQRNVARGITMVEVHFNWLNLAQFLIIIEGLLVILSSCLILLSPLARCYKDVCANSFSPHTTRLYVFL